MRWSWGQWSGAEHSVTSIVHPDDSWCWGHVYWINDTKTCRAKDSLLDVKVHEDKRDKYFMFAFRLVQNYFFLWKGYFQMKTLPFSLCQKSHINM